MLALCYLILFLFVSLRKNKREKRGRGKKLLQHLPWSLIERKEAPTNLDTTARLVNNMLPRQCTSLNSHNTKNFALTLSRSSYLPLLKYYQTNLPLFCHIGQKISIWTLQEIWHQSKEKGGKFSCYRKWSSSSWYEKGK